MKESSDANVCVAIFGVGERPEAHGPGNSSGQSGSWSLRSTKRIKLYVQLAESTDDKLAIAVLMDIAGEELGHAGQFLRLLYKLAPDEEKLYARGAKEVEKAIETAK